MYRKAGIVGLVLVLWTVTSFAAEQVLTVDPDGTEVGFTLGGTLHTVHGAIAVTRGEIVFDLETGSAAGMVVVDALSAETGNEKRDKKMHAEVLETGRFPQIVFTAESIEGTLDDRGHGSITLVGVVSIHGADHPLALSAEVQMEGGALHGTTTFAIPFVEWGMEDPSVFVLRTDKHVDVVLEVVGTVAAPPAPEEASE